MTTADRYRRLAELFDDTVSSVSEGDWDNASPCAEWTARDVLAHVCDSEVDIVTKVGLSVERSATASDDPVAAWREVREGMQAILDDPEQAGIEYESLGSTTTVEKTVDQFLCFDLIVHRWDIARATGADLTIPDEDVEAANAFMDAMGQMFYDYGASGPAVDVDADAPAQDRLVGRAGRDPGWSAG